MANGDESEDRNAVLKAISILDETVGGGAPAERLAELTPLLHREFTFVGPDGDVTPQAALLDGLRSKDLAFDGQFKRDITNVVLPTDTTAIVHSDLSFEGRTQKQAEKGDFRDTITLTKVRDEWQIFAWHLTRLPPVRPSEEREIIRFFKDYRVATEQKNRLAVATLIHEDYRIVNPDGSVLNGATMAMETEDIDFSRFERGDFNVKIDGDTAVATTVFSIQAKLGDRNFTGRYRDSNTFVRKRGSWRVVATQISRIPEF
jgi:ketosteroid isomerase-like protein